MHLAQQHRDVFTLFYEGRVHGCTILLRL